MTHLITPGETLRLLVSSALCEGSIVSLSIYLWLKHVISVALLMLLRTSERKLFQKPTHRGGQNKRIPSWMSKHPIFGSILQQLHDDHRFSPDPLCALAELKVLLHSELSRQTPDCIGAKLSITSTALRAYRNRQLGTLMRCCEAWKPIEDCFDALSFECIDFQRLATSLLALLVKTLQHVKLRSLPSLARNQKKTSLWLGVGIANEHGAIRNLC